MPPEALYFARSTSSLLFNGLTIDLPFNAPLRMLCFCFALLRSILRLSVSNFGYVYRLIRVLPVAFCRNRSARA